MGFSRQKSHREYTACSTGPKSSWGGLLRLISNNVLKPRARDLITWWKCLENQLKVSGWRMTGMYELLYWTCYRIRRSYWHTLHLHRRPVSICGSVESRIRPSTSELQDLKHKTAERNNISFMFVIMFMMFHFPLTHRFEKSSQVRTVSSSNLFFKGSRFRYRYWMPTKYL